LLSIIGVAARNANDAAAEAFGAEAADGEGGPNGSERRQVFRLTDIPLSG
jgi:hypothetical protein